MLYGELVDWTHHVNVSLGWPQPLQISVFLKGTDLTIFILTFSIFFILGMLLFLCQKDLQREKEMSNLPKKNSKNHKKYCSLD